MCGCICHGGAWVNALLDQTASKRGSEPLKQRITILRKAKASPSYSNARKQQVDADLGELESRLPLRADIVHGCLQLAEFENENRACFANARQIPAPAPKCGHSVSMTSARLLDKCTKLRLESQSSVICLH